MELEEIKQFLKVEGEEEDDIIQGLQLAAEEYLENAGIQKNYRKKLYKLAIGMLITHWYENRCIEVSARANKICYGIDTIIMQLRYSKENMT